jgi:hypothetical protein
MNYALGETVTVNRVSIDAHGNKTTNSTHTIAACAVWPSIGKEIISPNMDVVEFSMTVFMPPGSDILSTDEVVVRGTTYRVSGQPALHKSPFTGYQAGIEVLLQASAG